MLIGNFLWPFLRFLILTIWSIWFSFFKIFLVVFITLGLWFMVYCSFIVRNILEKRFLLGVESWVFILFDILVVHFCLHFLINWCNLILRQIYLLFYLWSVVGWDGGRFCFRKRLALFGVLSLVLLQGYKVT